MTIHEQLEAIARDLEWATEHLQSASDSDYARSLVAQSAADVRNILRTRLAIPKLNRHDYSPAFAILRVYMARTSRTGPIDEMGDSLSWSVDVLRVMWDADDADREAHRLNQLNEDKGSHYLVRFARVLNHSPNTSVADPVQS